MNSIKCQNLVSFFQNKNETQIFTVSKPNIMKRSKYQQYFNCFIAYILVSYTFWFSYQQNIVTILISAALRGEVLIRGEALIRRRRLIRCGYPKIRCLLGGGAYLRPGGYQKKYGIQVLIVDKLSTICKLSSKKSMVESFLNTLVGLSGAILKKLFRAATLKRIYQSLLQQKRS